MKIGYGRVSTTGQRLDPQTEALENFGCEKTFLEKRSGKSSKDRPELQNLLDQVRSGDVVVVTKLDRLGRSLMDLHQIVRKLDEKGVGFQVIENPEIDTTSAYGKMIFSILGTVSEFERDLINERCRVGREFSKQRGVKFGRKPSLTNEQKDQIRYLSEQKKVGWNELSKRFEVSRQTIYRVLRG